MLDRTRTRFSYLLPAFLLARASLRPVRILLARLVGSFGFRILRKLREIVIGNLFVVTRSRRRAVCLARDTFVHYSVYLSDYLSFPHWSESALRRLVTDVSGGEHLETVLRAGKGAVMITPHLGNWEAGGVWLAHQGFALNVVTLPEDDPRTGVFRDAMRKAHGIRSFYYDPRSASLESMIDILHALRRNELVAMLTDRSVPDRQEEVTLFGRPSSIPIGPFLLAWLSGAGVLPSYCVLLPDGTYRIRTEAAIQLDRTLKREESIRNAAREMARRYESYIRAYPDQWYNFYSYWSRENETAATASSDPGAGGRAFP